ncbi:MAG: extracellular solute-binding protein [Lachnospiraceae bacterium]|nr:extracellular solute-binding protein [Lachnospiraceae bacterium]
MKCFWGKCFRRIALILAAVLITACFAGCTSDDPKEEKPTPTPTPEVVADLVTATPTPTEAPTPTPDGKVQLTMWCAMEVNDVYYQPFMEAIKELKEKYPNAELELKLIDYYDYWEKLTEARQNDTLPDLIYMWGGHEVESAAESGMICSLDDAYAPYKGVLQEKMFSALTYNGSKYAVPFNLAGGAILYANMDLLESVGFDEIPKTLDDLYDCCDKLLAKGITPFAVPKEYTWYISYFMESLLQKTCGSAGVEQIYKGISSWDNPQVAKAVDIFREMIDKGYVEVCDKDTEGNEYTGDAVKNQFDQEKNAFLLCYSAAACEFSSFLNARLGVGAFPEIDASAGAGQLVGAPSDSIAVCNKDGGNQEFAAEYAFELAKRVSRNAYLMYQMAPVWTVDYDDSNADISTKKVAELLQNVEVLIPEVSVIANWKYNTYYELLPQVVAGTIDSSEFGKKIEAE